MEPWEPLNVLPSGLGPSLLMPSLLIFSPLFSQPLHTYLSFLIKYTMYHTYCGYTLLANASHVSPLQWAMLYLGILDVADQTLQPTGLLDYPQGSSKINAMLSYRGYIKHGPLQEAGVACIS